MSLRGLVYFYFEISLTAGRVLVITAQWKKKQKSKMVKTFQKSWKSFVILVTCLVIMVEHLKQSVKEQVVPRRNSELGGVLIGKQGFSFKQRPVLLYCSENWEATKGKDMHYHTITAHLMFQELLANDKSVIFTEKAAVTSNSDI